MELRQLRYLVAIADEQNFTRAARREHVAQPALSQQIQRLEAEVGVALVDRTTRHVRMTEAGLALVARARRVLAELDGARAELDSLAGLRGGRVTIGAMQTLGAFDLPRILARFHRQHPEVELSVREESSEALAAMVKTDLVDLALLSITDQIEASGLELLELVTEDVVALVPAGHPLASRERIRLEELKDDDFISFREGWAMRHLLTQASRSAGFDARIAFESNEVTRIRALVGSGLGVALMARSAATGLGASVRAVPLIESPVRDVTLAWRKDRRLSPAASALLERMRGK